MATPSGDENSPGPEPSEPNEKTGVPSMLKACTRWLPVSATTTVWSGATAIPPGDENSPGPEPSEPNTKAGVPSV